MDFWSYSRSYDLNIVGFIFSSNFLIYFPERTFRVDLYEKNLVINFSICPDLALSLILVLRLSLINLSFWWTRNKNSLTLELSFLVLIDHIIKNHDTFFRKYYIRYEMSTIFRQ